MSVGHPNPARVVADADVLAADLLVGGPARDALDVVRGHAWIELVASNALLADARAVIERCSDGDLATDWYDRIEAERITVEHPAGDDPALATAYRGEAAHLLTWNESLRRARTGARLRDRVAVSVKTPEGFCGLFDPASLYESLPGTTGPYPGPDCDPHG